MQIRQATPDDAGAIAAIHVASSRVAYRGIVPEGVLQSFTLERREKTWHEILATKEADLWIAEEGCRRLGWICLGRSRDPDADETTAELWAMYVDPDCWRQGVGRALWSHAEAQLKGRGFSRVTLWVLQENRGAVDFYRHIGFVEDPGHAITRQRGDAQLVDIRMRREVENSSLYL